MLLLILAGVVIFALGAIFMTIQGVLSLFGSQAALLWPYGYQVAMAMMVMGIGIVVMKIRF